MIEPVDTTSFDEWYLREYRSVVALVYTLSGSRGGAEDLAQDAFVEAHRRWDSIAGYEDPGAWVRKVAMNKASSRLRRRGAEARAYTRHMILEHRLPDGMSLISSVGDTGPDAWSMTIRDPESDSRMILETIIQGTGVLEIRRYANPNAVDVTVRDTIGVMDRTGPPGGKSTRTGNPHLDRGWPSDVAIGCRP